MTPSLLFDLRITLSSSSVSSSASTGLGVGKLLTLGGLFMWQIIDWFLIMGATRRRNLALAQQIQVSIAQMRPTPGAG